MAVHARPALFALLAVLVLAAAAVAPAHAVAPADLAVSITAPPALERGAPLVADVTVRNEGGTTAAAPVTVQLFVAGATAVTVSGGGWVCGTPTVLPAGVWHTCTRAASLAAGAAAAPLRLQATLASGLELARVLATVADPGGDPANDGASADVWILRADLTVSAPAYVAVARGARVQITVTVSNVGGAASAPPVVTTAASNLRALAANGAGWTCNGVPLTCTATAGLAPGASAPALTIDATAVDADAAGWVRVHLAPDSNTSNDSASTVVAIGDHPDLAVTVAANDESAATGGFAYFTVNVRNGGTATEFDTIRVRFNGDGLTPVQGTGRDWRCITPDQETVQCTDPDNLAGGTDTDPIVVKALVTAEYPDTASLTATMVSFDDLNVANDSDDASVAVKPGYAAALTVDPYAAAGKGETARVVVRVRNVGAFDLPAPVMVDFDFFGADIGGAGSGWECVPLRCTFGAPFPAATTLPPLELRGPVTVDPGDEVTLYAVLTHELDLTDDDDVAEVSFVVPGTPSPPPPPRVPAPEPLTIGDGPITLRSPTRIAWTAPAPTGLTYDVELGRRGPQAGNAMSWSTIARATTATSKSLRVSPGRTYCARARARDAAGNVSDWSALRCTAIPVKAIALWATGTWTRERPADAYAGQLRVSTTAGSALSRRRVQARVLAVLATRCPGCGSVDVRWNGDVVARLDLAAPTTERSQLLLAAVWPELSVGDLSIEVRAGGAPVPIEGLVVFSP
jgi:hypothetical protein